MSMSNIEHVVVLMLENRPFDSMVGWLYENGIPSLNIPPAAKGDEFRGLNGVDLSKFQNTADDGLSSPPVRGASGFTVPSLAPGEEFEHVNMQFFKTETPAPDAKATMTGVLQDFVNVLRKEKYSEPDIKSMAAMIMQTYTPSQLPVLNELARYYAVSDDWFASVPSQTNPNRAFLLTGTSHGLVNNGQLEVDPQAKEIEKILGMGIGDDRFPDNTIFNAVAAAGADWAVFWQTSYLPQKISGLLNAAPGLGVLLGLLSPALGAALLATLEALKPYTNYIKGLASGQLASDYTWRLFPAVQEIAGSSANFKGVDQFHSLARAGRLPKFSYIEPFWTIAQSSTDAGLKNLFTQMGNDYHPPGNMIVAENFVKEVYSSLIANPVAWSKTLLVITFDEFVGTFDHAAPPSAVPPWGTGNPGFPTNGFGFNRYGARVPTILVSPLVQQGTVFRSTSSAPYDHTSVIATTLKWLGQESRIASFGKRTESAPTFENVLTLSQPRSDAAAIGFLNVARQMGSPVRFGDSIVLKNQSGKYLTGFSRTMKVGTALPSDLMGFAVDLNLAAYFPTLDDGARATLTFRTSQADPPSQVPDQANLFIVTMEPGVGSANFLGAWSDSHDCYYYNNYAQGQYSANETWIAKQVSKRGQPLCYGDQIYLENSYFTGQRLSQDSRPFQGRWITTKNGGDYWVVEPAVEAGPAMNFTSPATGYSGIRIGSSPSLAVFNGKMYAAFQANDPGHALYVTSTPDGTQWDTPAVGHGGILIGSAPSLAVFNGRLYSAFQANDSSHALYVSSTSDGARWTTPAVGYGGIQIGSAPSLAVFNGRLYCAFQANDPSHMLYVTSSSDGSQWSTPATGYGGIRIGSAPSLAVFNGRLYCAFQANDSGHALYVTSTSDGSQWTVPAVGYGGILIGSAPSLSVFDGILYCAFQANDPGHALYVTYTTDGTEWRAPAVGYGGILVGSAPSVAEFNGKFYCAFQANDPGHAMYVTRSS